MLNVLYVGSIKESGTPSEMSVCIIALSFCIGGKLLYNVCAAFTCNCLVALSVALIVRSLLIVAKLVVEVSIASSAAGIEVLVKILSWLTIPAYNGFDGAIPASIIFNEFNSNCNVYN